MVEMKLKAGELTDRGDYGRGIARVDSNIMKQLGVREGEVIEISGKRATAAIVVRSYPADVGLNLIRIDGLVRKNCNVSIGEAVAVKKAEANPAEKIVLAPLEKGLILHVSPNLIRQNLFMRPVVKGDVLVTNPAFRREDKFDFFEQFFGGMPEVFFPFGSEIKLIVSNASPAGVVQISENTQIEISSHAAEVEETKIPTVTYEDIGGLGESTKKVREMIELPLRHPELFQRLGIEPPKGVLLHGPPGTGKTLLARAVANESGAHFVSLAGPEVVSKFYGESEANLRKIFEEAEKNAPSIIFIDEIDAIAPKREDVTGEVERRIVSQLLTLMDGLKSRGKVVVIAATNRPNAIDPALRRGGRFDREIEIGVPDKDGRKQVFQIHTRYMPLEKVDLDKMSEITHGFVGADISALAKEAGMHALRRVLPQTSAIEDDKPIPNEFLEKLKVTQDDFEYAMRMVQPSAMREVFVELPKTKWKDIGGLIEVKELLKESVEWPLKYADSFSTMGIKPARGILLYGPPGCGKTMIAKAVANEAGINFISIKGPQVYSKWVGESEKMIRDIFRRAKQVAPSIVFIDEIDALAPRRGTDAGSHVTEQVVSQLLTEMSGVEDMSGILVLAATNRPDIIDPALLRPGRFDKLIYVPAPDEETRIEILKVHTKNTPMKGVDIKKLAKRTNGYSGADLEAVVREAAMTALREDIKSKTVTEKHFDEALKKIKPSISDDMFVKYQKAVEEIMKAKIDEEEGTRYIG